MIKYLKHSDIDKTKWDNCIEKAENSLIYALSWYLDIVSPGWEALVLDDYKAVMPLTWKRKFGISYLYQPYFSQQLGVFSKTKSFDFEAFISAIPKKFKFFKFNINEQNRCSENILKVNSNYILDISKSYDKILNGYNRNCNRNIRKAEKAEFQLNFRLNAEAFTRFVKNNLEDQIKNIENSAFKMLETLIKKSFEKGVGEIVALFDSNNVLHAAGFFLKHKDRIIFSVCASTQFGKQNQAMYFLVNSQIQKYAGSYKWYDFSGSNIKGIAYFNSTFGAIKTSYITLSKSNLPKWITIKK